MWLLPHGAKYQNVRVLRALDFVLSIYIYRFCAKSFGDKIFFLALRPGGDRLSRGNRHNAGGRVPANDATSGPISSMLQ